MKNLRLKSARAALDLSQQDLAERVGVSRQTINAIEKGDYNPTIRLCVAPRSNSAEIYAKFWGKPSTNYSGKNKKRGCPHRTASFFVFS